jgi:hypothetical protein
MVRRRSCDAPWPGTLQRGITYLRRGTDPDPPLPRDVG